MTCAHGTRRRTRYLPPTFLSERVSGVYARETLSERGKVIYIILFRGGYGGRPFSCLLPRSLSSPPCVPLVPGLGAPRRKRRGPGPHEGHGGLAQAELK
nr:MAG TPA: hypothetical protein [Caudoviricetes sp.]